MHSPNFKTPPHHQPLEVEDLLELLLLHLLTTKRLGVG